MTWTYGSGVPPIFVRSPLSTHPTGPPRGTPSPKPRPGPEEELEETGVAGGETQDNDYLLDCILDLGARLTKLERLVESKGMKP